MGAGTYKGTIVCLVLLLVAVVGTSILLRRIVKAPRCLSWGERSASLVAVSPLLFTATPDCIRLLKEACNDRSINQSARCAAAVGCMPATNPASPRYTPKKFTYVDI